LSAGTEKQTDTKLSNVSKELHPADDDSLDGADVARKLTILSCLMPSLHSALPQGFKSVQMMSLVPLALVGVSSSDEDAAPVRVCQRLSARY